MTRTRRALTRFLLPVAVAGLLAAAPEALAAAREICVAPAQGSPGSSVAVPLFILDGTGVAAFQVDVHFDASLLVYVSGQLGPDTVAAGGWTFDSQLLASGLVRVIAYRMPPAALSAGLKRVGTLNFSVAAPAAIQGVPLPLSACVLGDVNGAAIPCTTCVQPGSDAAAPRFARSVLDDGFAFDPARIVIEQGDWALWENHGASRSHTTTSGTACLPDGLWRGVLTPGGRFVRQFFEPPGIRTYFSEPDCAAGMTGQVEVTGDILLLLSDPAPGTLLSWSGGSGRYRVHRSTVPSFVAHGTTTYSPDGGDLGTTLTDAQSPAVGQTFYYLVANSF